MIFRILHTEYVILSNEAYYTPFPSASLRSAGGGWAGRPGLAGLSGQLWATGSARDGRRIALGWAVAGLAGVWGVREAGWAGMDLVGWRRIAGLEWATRAARGPAGMW